MINSDELWTLLNQYRGAIQLRDRSSFIGNVKHFDSLQNLRSVLDDPSLAKCLNEPTLVPSSDLIQNFITELLKSWALESVLDPWCNLGDQIKLVKRSFPQIRAKGYVNNVQTYELLRRLNPDLEVTLGEPLELLDQENNLFDLVISRIPIRVKSQNKTSMTKDYGYNIIGKASERLTKNGRIIFYATPHFYWDTSDRSFRNNLRKHGLSIEAAFSCPSYSIYAGTGVQMSIIILSKTEQQGIFLGMVDDDTNRVKWILNNFREDQNGKSAYEGLLVNISDLAPIEQIADSTTNLARKFDTSNLPVYTDDYQYAHKTESPSYAKR